MAKWILMLVCCCSGYAQALTLQMSAGLPQGDKVTRLSKAHRAAPVAVPNAVADITTLTLADLLGEGETAELHGSDASLSINLPLPAWRELNSAHLLLQGTLSNALIAPSQMVVTVNEQVVGQIQLFGAHSQFKADINLSLASLHPGYNVVKIRVAQHYTEGCEAPLSGQLWTQINLQQSHFTLSSRAHMPLPRLDNLALVFDKTTWEQRPILHMLTFKEPSAGQLQAMALVAQGAALRYEYVPIRVFAERYQGMWPATGHVVLLGSRAELAPWLADLNVPQDGKPVLAVRALPSDSSRTLLLLAADDADGLNHLAQAFAMNELPLPNLSWVSLDNIAMPKIEQLPPLPALQAAAQTVIPLQYLGYKTTTFSGFDAATKPLRFWNNRWQGRMQMRLHLAYAAGMSPQSSMNVLVNGVMVGSIPLNDDRVGQYDDYAVSVPATVMTPGWNKLELQPVLIPQAQGAKCSPFFSGNLAVTVYDDSTLEHLGGSPLREPDLGLFASTGQTDLLNVSNAHLAVQLLDNDADTLSAALTLLSKMAQVQKRPLWQVWLGVGGVPADTGARILLGKRSLLPDDVHSELDASAHYAVNMPLGSAASDNSWYTLLPPSVRDFLALQPPKPKRTHADIALSADLSGQVFALALGKNAGAWTVFMEDFPFGILMTVSYTACQSMSHRSQRSVCVVV